MKRQHVLSLLTLAVVLGTTAQAAPLLTVTTKPHDVVDSPALEETTVKGVIRSIDADARSFTLVEGDKVHTIKFGAGTEFELDGKEATAKAALAKGRKVKVVKAGDAIKSVSVSSKSA